MRSRFIKFLLGGILVCAVIGLAVMLLWNWLMPAIFGLAIINFWQALGLLALCRILFGSFGKRGHSFFGHKENPIHKRWRQMTPEQRKEFVEKRRRFNPRRHFFDDISHEEPDREE